MIIFIKRQLQFGMCFLLLCVIGCNAPDSNWYFEGNGVELQLHEYEVPSRWNVEVVTNLPVPNAMDWSVVYNAPQDQYFTNSMITHSVTVFDKSAESVQFLQKSYQTGLNQATRTIELSGLQWSDFTPPPSHIYNSLLADEVKLLYYPEVSVAGPVVGYKYYVWARYGNVVSTFITIVEDPETTQITADEANVVPWSEVERMLKLIDQKFAEAGKQVNQ